MTNRPITEITINTDSNHDARRILVSVKTLRDEMLEQGFKTDIESIYLLGTLLDKVEDAALDYMLK